jgi:Xaa-Pro aminopeptidase
VSGQTSGDQISGVSDEGADPLPALERAVQERPDDATALVALANHYWLIGAGPEAVGDLASRAIASDPANRAGWHLWALAESNPRQRVARWQQVSKRFPQDELARANLADNAASLAGAEHDYEAVDLAIATYEELLATAQRADQRAALEKAIKTLKAWKF